MARPVVPVSMPISLPNKFDRQRLGRSRIARGFTLLEIMLVLALVAAGTLMLAAAFTRSSAGAQLRTEAAQLTNGLREARARALRTQATQRFVLDTAAHAWQVSNGPARQLPQEIHLALSTAAELREGSNRGAILFFPDGASSSGRVDLSRNGVIWRQDVHWLTGQVSSQRLDAK